MMPLRLEGVTVEKRGNTILDNFTLCLKPASATLVMGPNGSGKTTFLKLLSGLERVKKGAIIWPEGTSHARANTALVFQTPIMLRRSTLDNAAYPLHLKGTSRNVALDLAGQWLERVGLFSKAHMPAAQLSGGEKQKLAIARALAQQPKLLLLDEPTANLDGQSTQEIEKILLQAMEDGTHLMMATHSQGQARRLAERILFIHRGKPEEYAFANAFCANPRSEIARAFLKGDIVL